MLDMGMGTGKTKVVVDWMANAGCERVLVICPKYVVIDGVWPRNLQQHGINADEWTAISPTKGTLAERADVIRTHHESGIKRLLVVQNYECLQREAMTRTLAGLRWDAIVFDESHKLKAPGGKISLASLKLKAPKILALTGTPMPSTPGDIYAQFRRLDMGILGPSWQRFKMAHLVVDDFGAVRGVRDPERFHSTISRIMFHAGSEVLDLPDVRHLELSCRLEPKAWKYYREIEEHLAAEVDEGEVTIANAMVSMTKLQQVTGGWRDHAETKGEQVRISSAKQAVFSELIEGLGDEPIVVFCRFHRDLDAVHEACAAAGAESREISGRPRGQTGLNEWKAGEAQVLAAQIDAASDGIECVRAAYGVYWSVGFSPGRYLQSTRRIHRPGQERPVTYYHLLAEGPAGERTIDRYIYTRLNQKEMLNRSVLTPDADFKRGILDDVLQGR